MSGGLVVFRADASPTIGGGHVMRCLTLADALYRRGARCVFLSGPETTAIVPALAAAPHRVIEASGPDLDPGTVAAEVGRPEWLVVDSYALDATFERPFRAAGIRVCVIDDMADRPHDCDLLLDQTLGRREEDYRALVPPDACRLLGPGNALLRPQFAAARPSALARRTAPALRRVLVSLGAGDVGTSMAPVLDGLCASRLDLTVDVVLGAAGTLDPDVLQRVRRKGLDIALHHEVRDMAALMVEADLAIGGGGTSSWERCCLGLPALVVTIADNQNLIVKNLCAAGAIRSLGRLDRLSPAAVAAEVTRLAAAPAALAAMSRAGAAVCDGLGAERMAHLLLGQRPAEPE